MFFHRLGRNEIDSIVDLQFARLRKLLRERELDLELTPEARTALGDRGYDPQYGARPLKRALHALRAGSTGETTAIGRVPSRRHHRRSAPPAAGGDELAMERKPERRVAAVS